MVKDEDTIRILVSVGSRSFSLNYGSCRFTDMFIVLSINGVSTLSDVPARGF